MTGRRLTRRGFLRAGIAAGAALRLGAAAAALGRLPGAMPPRYLGPAQPFDYAALKGQARALAGSPYVSPLAKLPQAVEELDWDRYQRIRYRDNHLLWQDRSLMFEAAFFHLGLFFKKPVRMHELVDGQAREIAYDAGMFEYDGSGLGDAHLPRTLGFAGFRLNFHTDHTRDVAAFLGASYFRAVGGEWQYGLSARGLAVDCGMERAEEFPDFIAFWLQRPAPADPRLTVYALLDSPSIAGAYRFDITPGAVLVMDVDTALYPRLPIERVGIAPLTSMFQCAENDRRAAHDWRPEIHDSDGLALWTGAGERIWRPLVNPATRRFNAYADDNPRGFGLLQRDREFDHYQDDGVFYERRPSLWVEPRSPWGRGSVQLVELPTEDETLDNIVAFWCPETPMVAGEERLFGYRLHWGAEASPPPPVARVVATRCGIGGVVGRPRKYYSCRFAVDFVGGDLSLLGKDVDLRPVISASQGEIEITSVRPLAAIGGYRAMFDLVPPQDSEQLIDLRLFLSADGRSFSETWLYQWTPPPLSQRTF